MRNSVLGLFAASTVLALGAFAPAAMADTDGPYSTNTISHLTEFTGSPTDVLNFTQFNPTLGVLLSVQLSFGANLSSVVTVCNDAATPSSGSVFTQSQFTFTDPSNSLGLNGQPVNTNTFGYTLGTGQCVTSDPALTGNGTFGNTYVNPVILAEFTGFGTVGVGVSTFTQTFLANSGGNTSASQATSASVQGQVIYTYQSTQDVPEPGTWAMLAGMSTAGAGFVIRKRRARK